MTSEESVAKREWVNKCLPPPSQGAALVAGDRLYVEDMALQRMVHVAYLRSPYAHARIISIDAVASLEIPGIVSNVTGRSSPV